MLNSKGVHLRDQEWLPSSDKKEHPWIFTCTVTECIWSTAHRTKELAEQAQVSHDCPRVASLKVGDEMGLTDNRNFIQEIWTEMDDLVTEMFDLPPDSSLQVAELKGKLRGMARVISHWMPPTLSDPAEISQELARRRRARLANLSYTTMGVEERWYPVATRDMPKTAVKTIVLPAEPVIKSVRDAKATGMFPDEVLFQMYSINSDQLKAIMESV